MSSTPGRYLSVDGANHGSLQTHPRHKADVEVLVEDQRLQAGADEEESCVEVALPTGGVLVVYKLDQQPGKRKARDDQR